jgi:hypothetical protein
MARSIFSTPIFILLPKLLQQKKEQLIILIRWASRKWRAFIFITAIDELNSYRYEILYEPSFFRRQFNNDKNPFPWICIKKT